MFRQSLRMAAAPARAFSTTRSAALSRMMLIGRLVGQPEVRESRTGKEYVRYVIATNDPLGPPQEDGSPAPQTSSFHSVFGFGEGVVNRMRNVPKGTLMFVEADFRIEREFVDGTDALRDNYLVQHRAYLLTYRQLAYPLAPAPRGALN